MRAGYVFEDKYRIEGKLGAGGQGSVYGAEEIASGRRVAIKVRDRGDNAVRFIREGRAVSRLSSPYSVRLIEFARAESGQFYMVFEFIEGDDLQTLLELLGPMPWPRVAVLLGQLLHALAEAHDEGILHRDIKPPNIMLGPEDRLKILDFGVALVETGAKRTSRPHTFVGTTRYVAPEVLKGYEPSPRSDVFAVGLIAYELLVGERANNEERGPNVVNRQINSQPFELPEDLDLPDNAEEWVDRLLSKDPEARPVDAASALAELVELEPTAAPPDEPPLDDEERVFPSAGFEFDAADQDEGEANDGSPPRQIRSPGPPQPEPESRSARPRIAAPRFRWRYVWLVMFLAFTAAGALMWWAIRG